MSKGILHLYINSENVEIAKGRGINLSQLFNEFLTHILEEKRIITQISTDKELIESLKIENAKLLKELIDKNKELESFKQQIETLKSEIVNFDKLKDIIEKYQHRIESLIKEVEEKPTKIKKILKDFKDGYNVVISEKEFEYLKFLLEKQEQKDKNDGWIQV